MSVNFKAMSQKDDGMATLKVVSSFDPRAKGSQGAPFIKINGECLKGNLEANGGDYGTQITVWGNNKKLNPFEYFSDEVDTGNYQSVANYLKGKTVSFEYYSQKTDTGYLNYILNSPLEVGLFDDDQEGDDAPVSNSDCNHYCSCPTRQESISLGQALNLAHDTVLKTHYNETKKPIAGHDLIGRMEYYMAFLLPYTNMKQNINPQENQETVARLLEEADEGKEGMPWDA